MLNALMVSVIEGLVKAGVEVPVFKSSNIDSADDYNIQLFDTYYMYKK